MLAGSMRYVKRNCWSIHGPSLAAVLRPVNVAELIDLLDVLHWRTIVYTFAGWESHEKDRG